MTADAATRRLPAPPRADRRPTAATYHGVRLEDDYAWMHDVTSPEVVEHLAQEARYARAVLEPLDPLRERLARELHARTTGRAPVPPTRHGPYWYYTRRPDGHAHLQYLRAPAASWDGQAPVPEHLPGERTILDGTAVEAELGGFSLGAFRISPSHRYLAYGVDPTGRERFVVRVKDLAEDRVLPDVLTGCHYTCAFAQDERHLFYARSDERNRPSTVWRHVLGTSQDEDVLVHADDDPGVWLTVGSTRSGRYVVLRGGASDSTEIRLVDAAAPTSEPRVVRPRVPGAYYDVDHQVRDGEDVLWVLHNLDGPDFALARTRLGSAALETVLPHTPGRRLHGVMAFDRHVVVHHRTDGLPGFVVIDPDDTVHDIPHHDDVEVVTPASNPDPGASAFRFMATSPVTPPSVRTADLVTREVRTVAGMDVGAGPDGAPYDPDDHVVRRVWATSADGTRVPMTVVRRRDRVGRADPVVLYGYGSYERTADVGFSAHRLSLLDRGVSYAVAHVRGGGELGKHWHAGGRGLAKPNAIADYLACARQLVADGTTTRGAVVARSSSAGGIVVGAALNQDPALFAGAVLTAPFVDPLTDLLDPERELTVPEWSELGNPLDDPAAFRCILGYSPYENVAPVPYPPVLAIAGTQDARVRVSEPARWVARLRERAEGGPFVLLPDPTSGHRGPRTQAAAVERDALVTAWILGVVGRAG